MTPLPHSPFVDAACVDENRRFVLDENRFLQAVMEPSDKMPIFLSNPTAAYQALIRELGPIVAAFARR